MKVKFQYFAFIAILLAECLIAFQNDCPLVLHYVKETIQDIIWYLQTNLYVSRVP